MLDFLDMLLTDLGNDEEDDDDDDLEWQYDEDHATRPVAEFIARCPSFFNLCPVPRQDFFWSSHIHTAAEVLRVLNPCILVTFSFDVARVVYSNFHDRYAASVENIDE